MLRDRFKKTNYITISGKTEETVEDKAHPAPSVPEGLWIKCEDCGQTIYRNDWMENFKVCTKCSSYARVTARERVEFLADESTFQEWDADFIGSNPLGFPGYEEKLQKARRATGLREAVLTGEITIYGQRAAIAVCDAGFMMASMGEAVGEKITRAVEMATKKGLPVILYTASGGARMQEGMVSLMQMAKTSAALRRQSDAGLLTITVLTDPTTGGVTASFAMLGDIILAEPGALIGFAGPRVIEQTIGQKLPEGFQRAEFLLQHGFVDAVVERANQKEMLGRLLRYHVKLKRPIHMGRDTIYMKDRDRRVEEERKKEKAGTLDAEQTRTAWDRVQASRRADRPTALEYMEKMFRGFVELHGDRLYADDEAIVGGIATIGRMPVTVIGQQKGKNTKENIRRNFGMPKPEGYRKALRLMRQAEKFGRPVICFVDTPGAFCGLEAEERGQGEAIARNLFEMAGLKVPVLTILIGEGGSGGALAMAVANEVWMMENATYSILSPEGFASILWKDSKRAKEASEVMKITAKDLKELGIVEKVIPEFLSITSEKTEAVEVWEEQFSEQAAYMKQAVKEFVAAYQNKGAEELEAQRYERFRKY